MLSARDFRRLRLSAQLLSADAAGARHGAESRGEPGTGTERVTSVARHMLALQGQDWRASGWALGARAPGSTVSDVHDAFNSGLLVRSWPMRGTVHVMAAEDIDWVQRLTSRRVLAGAPKRREFLGLSDSTLDRMVEVVMQALEGGASLDRDELATLWTEAGIEWKSNWRYHVIWWICQNGLGVFAPITDGEPRLVAAAEWLRNPVKLEGDEALATLAVRYAGARGPVQARDLAWWTGLNMGDAKRAFSLGMESGELVPVRLRTHGATPRREPEYFCAPELPDSAGSVPRWLLLTAFDEYLLGYTDRSAQLDTDHFERIVPGRNGVFRATIVRDGMTVGTWKRNTRKSANLEITPFPGVGVDTEELTQPAADWASFHGIALGEITSVVAD